MTISGGMLSKQAQGPGASDSTLRTVEVPGFSVPSTAPSTVPSTRPFYQPAHSFLQPDGAALPQVEGERFERHQMSPRGRTA